MRFFERQKVDEIGILGVKLQKLLIFFMFLNVFTLLGGFLNFLWGLITMIVLYCGFVGAYKRRPRLLQLYFTFNVLMIVLTFVMVLLSVSVNSHKHTAVAVDAAPQALPPVNSTVSSNDGTRPTAVPVTPAPKKDNGGNTVSGSMEVKPLPKDEPQPAVDHQQVKASGGMIAAWVILFVLGLMVFALKISTLVLASRMIRMLKERQAHNLAHPIPMVVKRPTAQTQTQTPQPPAFQPIMYIPMPMQPNGNGAPFTPMAMYNPFVTPFQPQPPSSAPRV